MSSIDAAVVVDVTRLQRVFARLQFVGGGKTRPQCGGKSSVIVRNGV